MTRENKIWIIIIAVVIMGLLFSCLGGLGYLWYQSRGRFRAGPTAPAPTTTPRPGVTPAAKGAELNLPGADPPTLDPALAQDATSAEYIVEIFSGLVTINPDLEIVPDIAESWEVSEDKKVYTLYLRDDVKFHDGMPVTAHDFKYSIERACDPRTASPVADTYLGDIVGAKEKLRGLATEVSGVKVIDEHTLEIEIDAPKAYFLYNMSYPVAFVLDERNVERGGRTWTDNPNGTGPFKLAEYRLGERIVLERNEHYYGKPKPALERVNYILAGGSAMTMYETGELDAVPVGLVDIERVTDPANPLNKELTIVRTLSTFYLGFNVNEPPFDDVKVRRAFNMAIDKQKIVDVVYKKTVPAADTIVPPYFPNYENEDLEGYAYDPEGAKELIAESKYEDVTNLPEVTLYVTGRGGAPSRLIEAVVEMLKQNLGVEVSIQMTEWATFLMDLAFGQYQMFSLGWIADYPDPYDFLDILFHSQGKLNHTNYTNPEVDRFLEEARVEQDPAKRKELYREVEQMVLDDAPWVPLLHGVDYWLTKPYVEGTIYPSMIIPRLKYVSISK